MGFEYKVVITIVTKEIWEEDHIKNLEKLGKDGWEAYAVILCKGGNVIYHFLKRSLYLYFDESTGTLMRDKRAVEA